MLNNNNNTKLKYLYICFKFSSVSCFLDGVTLTGYNLTTTATANLFDCQIDCQVSISSMLNVQIFCTNVCFGSFF